MEKLELGNNVFCVKNAQSLCITDYTYNVYQPNTNHQTILLTKEGLDIRSTAKVLRMSLTTLLKRIITMAERIVLPPVANGKSYETDEMRTDIGKKSQLRRIVYALDRESKTVVSFNVGRRTNKTLRHVIKSLELSKARKIYTDKLKNYRYLIAKKLHNTHVHSTNHTERHNLSIRTHLKTVEQENYMF